jgi:CRISPR-associated protein Csx16
MTTWFVSRHPGAVDWARQQGLAVDRWVPHLEPADVQRGDTVAGTLPVQLAAEVCARGARYLHLRVDLPLHDRGRELDAGELHSRGAQLQRYDIAPHPDEAIR